MASDPIDSLATRMKLTDKQLAELVPGAALARVTPVSKDRRTENRRHIGTRGSVARAGGPSARVWVKDASHGGIGLNSRERLPKGTAFALRIDGIDAVLVCVSVYCALIGTSDKSLFRIGAAVQAMRTGNTLTEAIGNREAVEVRRLREYILG